MNVLIIIDYIVVTMISAFLDHKQLILILFHLQPDVQDLFRIVKLVLKVKQVQKYLTYAQFVTMVIIRKE
ncbi:unnamed protein product [Paramecium octaurelia]|uniref:Uncharacterized protein n=1 Tax=Paramecium octaurelia TaxID=43137 RepID=A0A8S1Y112_PAROT|nr:unnamed protein product [Paramecium octaurelia]